jgi:predicted DNA-binding transcriptional regulator YafY
VERRDRLERLTNLVLVLLDTERPLTIHQVADAVTGYPEGAEARRQAFERDKRTLREEGIPIVVEPVESEEQWGYRIRPEDYYLPPLGLEHDEQIALNLAVAGVHLDEGSGRGALVKLGVADTDSPSPVASLPSLPQLPRLHEALRARAPVRFGYRGEERRVEPYGLLFRSGFWYLVGWDQARRALRTFRVDRMDDGPNVGAAGAFEPPAGFDPATAFPDEPWRVGEGEVVPAEVLVDQLQAPLVEAELGESAVLERRRDGSVLVRLEVANEDAFRSWVLGLLEHAVVVGPEPLRQRVRQWLETLAGPPTTPARKPVC